MLETKGELIRVRTGEGRSIGDSTMDKSVATQMIRAALSIGEHLNRLTDLCFDISNEGDQREFRKSLGEAMGLLCTDIMMPIIKEHPDLDPDTLGYASTRKTLTERSTPTEPECSFCEKKQQAVLKLIAGAEVFICGRARAGPLSLPR